MDQLQFIVEHFAEFLSLLICRLKFRKKTKNILIARLGESYTKTKLIANGFFIYESNYETKFGELDLIASKNRTLYFIEVKTRKAKNIRYFSFRDQISEKKNKKLKFLANRYKKEFISKLKARRIIKYKIVLIGVSYKWEKNKFLPSFKGWQVEEL